MNINNADQTKLQPSASQFRADIAITSTRIPTFSYPGGKCRLAKTIVSFMPPAVRIYLEPFAGRGNVFFRASSTLQYSQWHLNDIRMAPFFHAIITHGNTVKVPEHSRAQFELQRKANRSSDPTAILLAPYLTYSGAGYSANYRSAQGSPLRHHYQNTLRRAHQTLTTTRPPNYECRLDSGHQRLGRGRLRLF
jgi:hypothetical protein